VTEWIGNQMIKLAMGHGTADLEPTVALRAEAKRGTCGSKIDPL